MTLYVTRLMRAYRVAVQMMCVAVCCSVLQRLMRAQVHYNANYVCSSVLQCGGT